MAVSILRAAVFATITTLSACGGGDDTQEPAVYLDTAQPGSISSVAGVVAMRATVTSLAYTNTTGSAVNVEMRSSGQIKADGECSCHLSREYRIDNATTISAHVPTSGSDWTSAAGVSTVTLAHGETIVVVDAAVISNPVGAVTISWAPMALQLTITP